MKQHATDDKKQGHMECLDVYAQCIVSIVAMYKHYQEGSDHFGAVQKSDTA
jgi:hypothetical protein